MDLEAFLDSDQDIADSDPDEPKNEPKKVKTKKDTSKKNKTSKKKTSKKKKKKKTSKDPDEPKKASKKKKKKKKTSKDPDDPDEPKTSKKTSKKKVKNEEQKETTAESAVVPEKPSVEDAPASHDAPPVEPSSSSDESKKKTLPYRTDVEKLFVALNTTVCIGKRGKDDKVTIKSLPNSVRRRGLHKAGFKVRRRKRENSAKSDDTYMSPSGEYFRSLVQAEQFIMDTQRDLIAKLRKRIRELESS